MLIAICDDESAINEFIKHNLTTHYSKFIKTICFTSAKDMINCIVNERIPDAIIMDICVGQDNGIQILKKVKNLIENIPVIFITGHMEYCQDIFLDFQPWGLLTKPIDKEKLYYHFDKILHNYNCKNLSINITFNGITHKIKNSDIIYIESFGRKVIYHCTKNTFEEYIKLDNALKKLQLGFLRCHKSYAVNSNHILKIKDTAILLDSNFEIPISRSFKESVKKAYFEYESGKIGM